MAKTKHQTFEDSAASCNNLLFRCYNTNNKQLQSPAACLQTDKTERSNCTSESGAGFCTTCCSRKNKTRSHLTEQDRELSVHTGFSVCKVCLLCISADLFLIMQHSVLSNCVARLIWFGLRLMVDSSWREIRNARWRSLLYVS